jgi:hypothetical protein
LSEVTLVPLEDATSSRNTESATPGSRVRAALEGPRRDPAIRGMVARSLSGAFLRAVIVAV